LVQINIDKAIYKRVGPVKKPYSLGITTLGLLPNGDIIVGTGAGIIAKVSLADMSTKVYGIALSIA